MMWGARDARRRGLKLAINSFGINVRGRVEHFCQLVRSFLRNVRRGCGRNSGDMFGEEDLRKCRLQRRSHGSFEIEETADVTLLGRVGCIMHGVQAFERERPPRNPKHLLLPRAEPCRKVPRARERETPELGSGNRDDKTRQDLLKTTEKQ